MDKEIKTRGVMARRNMKKLFLTSIKIDLLPKLISGEPAKTNLVFIPTAADPYSDKWFVEADRKKLSDLGFKLNELDLKGKTPENIKVALNGVGIIYVAGGNTFYLLQKVRESGFDKVVKDLVEKGVLYVGSSAGAVIAGPTIEPIKFLDDPAKAPGLKSFEGLGLIDFVVMPHYGKEKYKEKYEKTMREFTDKGFKLIPITDEQSIIVEGDNYRILE